MWLTGLVAPRHVGSSQTRARIRVPCIGRQILNCCATREAPSVFLELVSPSTHTHKYWKTTLTVPKHPCCYQWPLHKEYQSLHTEVWDLPPGPRLLPPSTLTRAINTQVHTHASHTHTHVHLCTFTHMHTYTRTHTCTCSCTHTPTHITLTHIHTHTHA